MPNIIGEEFSKFVYEQINVRQKIHGSGTSNNPRSNEYINYLNSKTAWVKLASGVKITPERLEKEGITAKGFHWNGLAKNRVLYGGVSRLNESSNTLIQRGTDPTKNNITDYYTGTYNVNQKQQSTDLEFGLVPMPGITDVSIKNKNRGSIKEATVKIKAYTRDQFDFLDLLYMRLGYTVFLEWGWSVYFNNKEEYQNMGYTLIEANDGFFSNDWGTDPDYGYTQFLSKIRGYRSAKNGNYDGLLAKVRNFEWTISEDGTYDITLSLISMGDVIESLKTNIPPSIPVGKLLKKLQALTDENEEEDSTAITTLPTDNSLLAYLYLYKLTAQQDKDPNFNDITYTKGNFRYKIGRFLQLEDSIDTEINERYQFFSLQEANEKEEELRREFQEDIANGNIKVKRFNKGGSPNSITPPQIIVGIGGTVSISNPFKDTKPKDIFQLNYQDEDGKSTENGYYIRLGNLLTIINSKIIPKESKSKNKIININTSQWGNFMYYHPLQFSHDPRVCIVNSELIQPQDNIKILPQITNWHQKGKDYAWTMNIYVNFIQVENSMNENLDEEGNLSLFSFLSSLCTAINKAMGGVNNLEPVLDEETNTINIIDGSYTPNKSPNKKYGLELYGYNPKFNSSNFVRNFSIKSTISKEYASMVSIGSTAGGYTKGTEATMFSKWNNGLIDRFKEKYEPGDPDSVAPSGSQDEAVTNYIENILKTPTQGLGWADDTPSLGLDDTIIDSNLSITTEFYKYVQSEIQKAYPKYASPIAGFIPINLNTTLDGISGMKIYNVVRVSTRFLPKNYTESLRFIIKSVDHKLSNNDWETSIDTVVIPENYDEKGSKLILPYDKLVDEVRRILKEGLAKLPDTGTNGGDPPKYEPSPTPPAPEEVSSLGFGLPVGNSYIFTSLFKRSKLKLYNKPVTTNSIHQGIDIQGPNGNKRSPSSKKYGKGTSGDAVYAVADGVVDVAGWGDPKGFGNRVYIVHQINGKKYYTRYGHIAKNSIPPEIKRGAKVKKGQKLGLIGTEGSISTGLHLHFELYEVIGSNLRGIPLDPLDYLPFFEENGGIIKGKKAQTNVKYS